MQIVYAYKDAAVKVDREGPVSPLVPRHAMRAFREVEAELLLPCDRVYLSLFYDFFGQIVQNDAVRQKKVFENLEQFRAMHSRSLAASPAAGCRRLLEGIGLAMVKFMGSGTAMPHSKAFAACRALAWRFAIHGDD